MKEKIKRVLPFLIPAFILGFTLLFPDVAFAEDSPISTAGTEEVDKLTDLLCTCVEAAGDILMLFGVVKYGEGMASDQAKELTTGVTSLVTGVILANIGTVLGI